MKSLRKIHSIAIALLVVAAATGSASGEEKYPSRAITVVVPFSAGGPTDVLARIIGQSMSTTLGQQIVIENTTGAGGSIGAARVAKASPDGYTLVMGNLGTHAAAVGIYKNLSYDPRKDFEPVILVASTPMVLVTKKGFPAHTLKEVIAYAKEHKGKVTNGSAGSGSISHLTLLLFNQLTGADLQHVPYRGLSQATNDLLGGQIDTMFDQVVTATPHIKAGGEIGVAVTNTTRAPSIPDVPSSTEAGLAQLQTIAWSALFAPKGTSLAIVNQLNAAVQKAMQDAAVAKQLAGIGADIPPPDQRSPQALGHLVSSEIDKWVPLIRSANISQ